MLVNSVKCASKWALGLVLQDVIWQLVARIHGSVPVCVWECVGDDLPETTFDLPATRFSLDSVSIRLVRLTFQPLVAVDSSFLAFGFVNPKPFIKTGRRRSTPRHFPLVLIVSTLYPTAIKSYHALIIIYRINYLMLYNKTTITKGRFFFQDQRYCKKWLMKWILLWLYYDRLLTLSMFNDNSNRTSLPLISFDF